MRVFSVSAMVLAAGMFLGQPAQAQELSLPKPSPEASCSTVVGNCEITIIYHRPGVKGRQIWGSLVPYDTNWRTGANDATKITFSKTVNIMGQEIKAGTYALFTIPSKNEWTIILNKNHKQWGNYSYKEKMDVARFTVKPETTVDHMEWMSLTVQPGKTMETGEIVFHWEKKRWRLPIKTNVIEEGIAMATKAMENLPEGQGGLSTAVSCANFLLHNNTKLDLALEWVDKGLALQKTWWAVGVKSKILAKMGKYDEAITVAEAAIKMGKEAGRPMKAEQAMIATWQKKKSSNRMK